MNLSSARGWRCKRTGGAQIPVTLFTLRYPLRKHCTQITHCYCTLFHNISPANSAFVFFLKYSTSVCILPPSSLQENSMECGGALGLTPSLTATLLCLVLALFPRWPELATPLHPELGLDRLGSACKPVATMPQKETHSCPLENCAQFQLTTYKAP